MATQPEPRRPPDDGSSGLDEERQRQIEQNRVLIEALRSWRENDDPQFIAEQRETLEVLMRGLNEGRAYRKLFP